MLIDWFTIGAQALNFLILVWLMKRFLYKPILHAIDAREQRIARELAEADKKKADAALDGTNRVGNRVVTALTRLFYDKRRDVPKRAGLRIIVGPLSVLCGAAFRDRPQRGRIPLISGV